VATKNDIYGPDLSEHEAEAAAIAKSGMKCMQSNQSTSEAEKCDGDDASKNGLESLMK